MRYLVLTLLCLVAVIAYVQRVAISLPAPDIQTELGFGAGKMGTIMAAFYLGYALLQVPAGWLTDRWGSRRALACYAALWSALMLLTGQATGLMGLIVLWGCVGVAQAGVFPACAKAIGDWFTETQRALCSGLLAASMAFGAALAPLLTAQLLEALSWRQIFALYALPGLVWAQLFFLLIPERRANRAPSREPLAWKLLFTSPSMILLCLQQFLRASAMVFFYTWFPTYLRDARQLSQSEVGEFAFWLGLAAMLGGILGGHCSDWLLRRTGNRRLSRQGIAIVGMTACALLAAGSYFVQDTAEAILLLSLGAFAGTFGGVSGYAVAIEFGGRHVGTVFSVMNMWGNLGAFLFPLGIGWLVEYTGNWDAVLFIFAGCFAADAVCWALLKPRGPLFEVTDAPGLDAAEPLPSRTGTA